jgi:hypothetical protein
MPDNVFQHGRGVFSTAALSLFVETAWPWIEDYLAPDF